VAGRFGEPLTALKAACGAAAMSIAKHEAGKVRARAPLEPKGLWTENRLRKDPFHRKPLTMHESQGCGSRRDLIFNVTAAFLDLPTNKIDFLIAQRLRLPFPSNLRQ